MERKLKIILCVVVVILIALISFLGIYTKDTVLFKNHVPELSLSSDFDGKRMTSLIIDDGVNDVIFDADGNEVSKIPEGANKDDYKTEARKINADEKLTVDNYKKVKEILDKRLKALGVKEYQVRLDESTGDIAVELEENLDTDTLVMFLTSMGDFSIKDAQDGKLLLDRNDLKQAKVLYNNTGSNGVNVYLDLVFNKEGAKKLRELSTEYVEKKSEEEGKESEKKQVTLTLEGAEMLTTYFGEEITTGELTISLGAANNSEDLQEYVEQASFYAALLNNEEMPLTYKVGISKTIQGNLNENDKNIILGSIIGIGLIISVYLIVRYKVNGIFGVITLVSALALLILAARYTATEISLNSTVAVILVMFIEAYLLTKILESIKKDDSIDNVNKAVFKDYLKYKEIIIITLIIAVVFTFMQYVQVFTFGMTLFYGIISLGIANLLFLRTLLLAKYSKN